MPQWKEHRPSILRPKFAKNLELGFFEVGREFGDYPASPPCLTSRKTKAQDGLESDLRCHRDSLTLLPYSTTMMEGCLPQHT